MNSYIWVRYKLYCYNRGISEGNYNTFKKFMEEGLKIKH